MKRTLLALLLGLTGFWLGWNLSTYVLRFLMAFLVPPQVSVTFARPTQPFEIHGAWALLVAAWGVTVVFCTRNRWRTVLMSIAAGISIVCLSVGIQKLIVRSDVQTQQAMQVRPVMVSLDELALARTPMLGAVATCVVALFVQRIQRRSVAN